MLFFILLIIVGGLAWWGLWTLFVKSAIWTIRPLIEYFKEKGEDVIATKNYEPKEGSSKLVITIASLQKNGSHKEERIEVGQSKKDNAAANNVPSEEAKPKIDPLVLQLFKGKRQVRLTCKCPECRKYTTCYDIDIQKARCTSCNWVNKIDPPMTLEEYIKVYYMLIDTSELGIKNG